MLFGGGYHGQRLSKIYRGQSTPDSTPPSLPRMTNAHVGTMRVVVSIVESVTEPEILEILLPMIKRCALKREEGEHFGDFVIRAGYIAPTLCWYDGKGFIAMVPWLPRERVRIIHRPNPPPPKGAKKDSICVYMSEGFRGCMYLLRTPLCLTVEDKWFPSSRLRVDPRTNKYPRAAEVQRSGAMERTESDLT